MTTQSHTLKTRAITIAGVALVALFFLGFGGWAALAPLSRGALAVGTIVTATNAKKIEHLEGGIVETLRVREGDLVARGRVLFALDATRARAALREVAARYLALKCREARLLAERDGRDRPPPADLSQFTDLPEEMARDMAAAEVRIFKARRVALASQESILRQKTMQYGADARGLEAEMVSRRSRRRLIADELRDANHLIKKGLKRRPEYLRLRRQAAELDGGIARGQSLIARTHQGIAESELRIQDLKFTHHREVVQELGAVQSELGPLRERLIRARDVLARTRVVAPFEGYIVDLKINAPGEVIAPGETLMEIAPVGKTPVIDARVKPTDIDIVRPGMSAQIRFSGFNQRVTPLVNGVVRQVSADSIVDERTSEAYYTARVEIVDTGALRPGMELRPGMPAELLIVSASRTTLDYLTQPIRETMAKAMREQ